MIITRSMKAAQQAASLPHLSMNDGHIQTQTTENGVVLVTDRTALTIIDIHNVGASNSNYTVDAPSSPGPQTNMNAGIATVHDMTPMVSGQKGLIRPHSSCQTADGKIATSTNYDSKRLASPSESAILSTAKASAPRRKRRGHGWTRVKKRTSRPKALPQDEVDIEQQQVAERPIKPLPRTSNRALIEAEEAARCNKGKAKEFYLPSTKDAKTGSKRARDGDGLEDEGATEPPLDPGPSRLPTRRVRVRLRSPEAARNEVQRVAVVPTELVEQRGSKRRSSTPTAAIEPSPKRQTLEESSDLQAQVVGEIKIEPIPTILLPPSTELTVSHMARSMTPSPSPVRCATAEDDTSLDFVPAQHHFVLALDNQTIPTTQSIPSRESTLDEEDSSSDNDLVATPPPMEVKTEEPIIVLLEDYLQAEMVPDDAIGEEEMMEAGEETEEFVVFRDTPAEEYDEPLREGSGRHIDEFVVLCDDSDKENVDPLREGSGRQPQPFVVTQAPLLRPTDLPEPGEDPADDCQRPSNVGPRIREREPSMLTRAPLLEGRELRVIGGNIDARLQLEMIGTPSIGGSGELETTSPSRMSSSRFRQQVDWSSDGDADDEQEDDRDDEADNERRVEINEEFGESWGGAIVSIVSRHHRHRSHIAERILSGSHERIRPLSQVIAGPSAPVNGLTQSSPERDRPVQPHHISSRRRRATSPVFRLHPSSNRLQLDPRPSSGRRSMAPEPSDDLIQTIRSGGMYHSPSLMPSSESVHEG